MRTTIGRCYPCKTAYKWPSGSRRRLGDAYCPECATKLQQTTRTLKSARWSNRLPIFAISRQVAWLSIRREP